MSGHFLYVCTLFIDSLHPYHSSYAPCVLVVRSLRTRRTLPTYWEYVTIAQFFVLFLGLKESRVYVTKNRQIDRCRLQKGVESKEFLQIL